MQDKDVDLLLRVARHKSGLSWEVSYGIQQPAQPLAKDAAGAVSAINSITAAAAVTAAADLQVMAAASDANTLALLAAPSAPVTYHLPTDAGTVVKAVVVGDAGLELAGMTDAIPMAPTEELGHLPLPMPMH